MIVLYRFFTMCSVRLSPNCLAIFDHLLPVFSNSVTIFWSSYGVHSPLRQKNFTVFCWGQDGWAISIYTACPCANISCSITRKAFSRTHSTCCCGLCLNCISQSVLDNIEEHLFLCVLPSWTSSAILDQFFGLVLEGHLTFTVEYLVKELPLLPTLHEGRNTNWEMRTPVTQLTATQIQ